GVRYFPAYSSPQTFADRILSWMDEAAVVTADVTGVQPITWEDSVTTLLEVLKSHGFEAKPLRGK
ncbi:hypothetical protein, partial [Mesorhizobium japonicum]|uniref:hypothetical protein n=1 Tax=Mesorhizobium japonicum TaxID=2066070 RepID=UPI003B5A9DCF